MKTKRLTINKGTTACPLSGKLRRITIATLIIRRSRFSDKNSTFDKITLVENDLIIDQNEEIAKTFNDFFTKVVSNLNITQYGDPSVNFE